MVHGKSVIWICKSCNRFNKYSFTTEKEREGEKKKDILRLNANV